MTNVKFNEKLMMYEVYFYNYQFSCAFISKVNTGL